MDFSRNEVYLQTRKRDGGLEGDWVPMTEKLSKELDAWRKERESMIDMDEDHMFVCLTDTPFCDNYYGRPFKKQLHFMKKICKRAGLKPFWFHAIRHLFASKLWQAGMSLGEIQQMLRHKGPRVTEKYLQFLGLEKIRKSLNSIFNPVDKEPPE